jgi:acetyl-CoA C-acetyltransferase
VCTHPQSLIFDQRLLCTAFADAAADPMDFPTAPTIAIPKALKMANVSQDDVALFELNEAFSVVVRAAEKIMNVDPAKINVNGGAVALGHVSSIASLAQNWL